MARQLLPAGSGASKTGPWVRVQSTTKSANLPFRIQAVGNFAADNVFIEELIGGIPGKSNSPYGPSADTGTVEQLGTIAVQGADLIISGPVEFIRARTGPNLTGTCQVFCETAT